MIALAESTEGIVFTLKARPGGKRSAILGEHDGALKVSVTAAADKGKANQAILELLADQLGLRRADLEIIRGATSRDKTIRVVGISAALLAQRLQAILGSDDATESPS